MEKKYIVRLSEQERTQLCDVVDSRSATALLLIHAQTPSWRFSRRAQAARAAGMVRSGLLSVRIASILSIDQHLEAWEPRKPA